MNMNKMNQEDPLARAQQTKDIVGQLRKKIILGSYAPGSRLVEAKVASELQYSRAPVRTALQILAQEGLVMSLSNGGTEVVGFTVKHLDDVFRLRLMLEQKAVELLLEQPSFHYRPLFDVMEAFDALRDREEKSASDISSLDIQFHRSLLIMSGNHALLTAWNTMANTMQTILEITNRAHFSRFEPFYDEHQLLADMIIKRDPAVHERFELHISNAREVLVSKMTAILNQPKSK